MTYLLILVIHFSVGVGANEPLVIIGETWPDEDKCRQEATRTAEWLTQDFVAITTQCVPMQNLAQGQDAHTKD